MPALSTDRGTASNGGSGQPAAPSRFSGWASRPYWLGIGISLIGAVWLWGASSLPQGARYAAVGPGLFVTMAGLGLLILGAILVVQIARGETFEPQDAEDASGDQPMDKRAFLTALLAVFLPVATAKTIGLPIVASISFMLVARAFGSTRWWLDLIIGLVLCTAAYVLFTRLGLQLGRYFPPLGF